MIQGLLFWAVLAGSVSVFWLLPARIRTWFLALVSIAYLATLDAGSVGALILLTVLFYGLSPQLAGGTPRGRRILVGLILIVCTFLGMFKYMPTLLAAATDGRADAKILIPLGISYYSFKLIHFAIEASRGTIKRGAPGDFLLYMFFFPIFTAGPIERYDHFIANRTHVPMRDDLVQGTSRIILGVIKQGVVADLLLRAIHPSIATADDLVADLAGLTAAETWLVVIRTYLYVYVGFSAYCDIAIGACRLFGFRILENFNLPILASNMADYWQRWHMTLSRWCQTYIYMPALAYTRNPYLALHASFFVMGMWHEASMTRLAWGLYHAWGVAAYMVWSRIRRRRKWSVFDKPPWRLVGIVLTQAYVVGSWAILTGEDSTDLYQGIRVLAKLASIDLLEQAP